MHHDPDAIAAAIRDRASGVHAHTPGDSPATVPPRPPDLAFEQDILPRFVVANRGCGVVGEDATAATTYLAIRPALMSPCRRS
jgi:hypothetical protein